MKKCLLVFLAAAVCAASLLGFGAIAFHREQALAMSEVIRLHVRADSNGEEAQALKLQVRDAVLKATGDLLADCTDVADAKAILTENLSTLREAGQCALRENGSSLPIRAALTREHFEYREYGEFFLPEGEYESLIVEIGSGEGDNWWCVVFPAACYAGSAESVQSDASKMPSCFRLATKRATEVKTEFFLFKKLREWFS